MEIETLAYMQGVILAVLAAMALQNYKNHGCLKKLEGKLDTHLSQKSNK